MMKKLGHFGISMIKSVIRIAACVFVIPFVSFPLQLFALGILIAEVLGIYEEIVEEKRKHLSLM